MFCKRPRVMVFQDQTGEKIQWGFTSFFSFYTKYGLWFLCFICHSCSRSEQGVTKKCRLSWLINSVLLSMSPNAGGGVSCGASANECSWARINFGDLIPYLTYVSEAGIEVQSFNYYIHYTLCQNLKICIPRNATAWPRPKFLHSCIWELFMYSHYRSYLESLFCCIAWDNSRLNPRSGEKGSVWRQFFPKTFTFLLWSLHIFWKLHVSWIRQRMEMHKHFCQSGSINPSIISWNR